MAAPKQSTASRSGSDVLIRPLNMVAVILAIQLQRFARSRSTWVFLLGMPLLIVLTLGIALQGAINSEFVPYRPFRLAIAPAGSAAFDAVQSAFETSTDFFDVSTTARDEADARSRVVRREVDVAVIVPEDFPFAPFTVISGPESLAGGIVEAVAHSVLADWIGRELFSDEGPVRLETRQLAAPPAGAGTSTPTEAREPFFGVGAFQYFSVTVSALFAMFAAHSAMTGYNDDLATGVYSRVRATGASRALYLFAGFANAAVRCVVYMALIAVLTRLLFGVSWGHVATWGLLTVASAAAMAGLSLVAMAIAPSRESVEPIGNLIFQVAGFLGGSMLPLHLFPPWMLSAFRWLPNRVMIEGYFKVASGAAVAGIGHEIRALGLAALVLAGAGWAVATVQKRGDERR